MNNNPFYEFYATTNKGIVRPHNEDAITLSPEFGLAIVADGMGGYQAGEVASGLACALLRQDIEHDLGSDQSLYAQANTEEMTAWLTSRIQRANQAILNSAHAHEHFSEMGTTLVLGLFLPHLIWVCHLGDSRAYRFRQGKLSQLTLDHSWLQEQITQGLISETEARYSNHRHLVTKALGIEAEVAPDILSTIPVVNDIYLLCTDGLTEMLEHHEISAIVEHHAHDLAILAQNLVEAANLRGGHDNISVALIRAQPRPKKLRQLMFDSFLQRLFKNTKKQS